MKLKSFTAATLAAASIGTPALAGSVPAQGVGNYIGAGVTVNSQGVEGNGYGANRVITGGAVQGRYVAAGFSDGNAVSIRPYVNLAGGANGQIGAGGGVLASYDISVAKTRTGVSTTNVYLGAGYQIPFVNGTDTNYQSVVGNRGQFVGVVGIEGRLTDVLVGFADLKFPTVNSSEGGYSPVFTTGIGFKF